MTQSLGTLGGPDEIQTSIDLNEEFLIKIWCDETEFYLSVENDPQYPGFPHEMPFDELEKVVLKGNFDVISMGFGSKGKSMKSGLK